jgi:antitoxin HicB
MGKPIDVEQYIRAPYTRMIVPDEESGIYTGTVLELEGCITQGSTPEETYARIDEMMGHWIRSELRAGHEIPTPHVLREYSGRLVLRLPRSLHRRAVDLAQIENVSLNFFLMMAVSRAIGSKATYLPLEQPAQDTEPAAKAPKKPRAKAAPKVAANTRALRKR